MKKPGTRASAEFVLFDVLYEDGSHRPNAGFQVP